MKNVKDVYRHYKGGLYEMIATARITESAKELDKLVFLSEKKIVVPLKNFPGLETNVLRLKLALSAGDLVQNEDVAVYQLHQKEFTQKDPTLWVRSLQEFQGTVVVESPADVVNLQMQFDIGKLRQQMRVVPHIGKISGLNIVPRFAKVSV